MSIINIDDYGCSERQHDQNWAAEYARRLVANEVTERIAYADEKKTEANAYTDQEVRAAKANVKEYSDVAIDTEAAARAAADTELSGRISALSETAAANHTADSAAAAAAQATAETAQTTANAAKTVAESALTEIPPASPSVLGGIKPLSSGKTNRSGLVISADGTTYVNVKSERGISRDGAGQIGINAASQDEVKAGAEAYKPVTPKTLKAELERIDAGRYQGDLAEMINITNGTYTNLAEVGQDLNEVCQLRYYERHPVRIGYWVDGMPVWRAAFAEALTAQEIEDKAFNAISSLVKDASSTYGFILGGRACLNSDTPTMVDGLATTLSGQWFEWNDDNVGEGMWIYGYVEFVTSESNIA